MTSRILTIVAGVLTLVIGLVLSGVILNQAATSGTNANIGSFSGAQALNDLIPLLYYSIIVLVAVGLMGIGSAGFAGRGPLKIVVAPLATATIAAIVIPAAAPILLPVAVIGACVYGACAAYGEGKRKLEELDNAA